MGSDAKRLRTGPTADNLRRHCEGYIRIGDAAIKASGRRLLGSINVDKQEGKILSWPDSDYCT
jgi:hypothetical protein